MGKELDDKLNKTVSAELELNGVERKGNSMT